MRSLSTTSLALLCLVVFSGKLLADGHIAATDALFECSLNDGMNRVIIERASDNVEYRYFDANGRSELSISTTLQTLDYRPYQWDRTDITESVTFYNGDTSYQVFSMMTRSGINFIGGDVGGIIVTTPSGQRTELQCDRHSVEPANVFRGIGRLAFLSDENYDPFDQCLSSDLGASACINVHAMACQKAPGEDTSCLAAEQRRWRTVLADTLSVQRQVGTDRQYSLTDIEQIDRAQILWEASRDFDCEISAWINYDPFDGESGNLLCLSDYTAQRVDFLDNFALGIEFDG